MKCKYCGKGHNGEYGSGQFCSEKCARGFSTKKKRAEINNKVSLALKGRKYPYKKRNGGGRRGKQKRSVVMRRSKSLKLKYKIRIENTKFEDLSVDRQKERLLKENHHKCEECGQLDKWNGKLLKFELHHIDGNRKNKRRENCKLICPNCHSQTDNDRFIGRKHSEESKNKITKSRFNADGTGRRPWNKGIKLGVSTVVSARVL